MSGHSDTTTEDEAGTENLYEVTVTVEYRETFDHESKYKERSEEFGEHLVKEDLENVDIPVDAMDISAQAMEVH